MSWGVYDYPEPPLEWEKEHFTDCEEYTDEWEEFNLDEPDVDELYEADEDDLL